MISYILKRILSLIPTLFVVSIVVFLVVYMIPGGPATALLGMEATPESIEALNTELGSIVRFLFSMQIGFPMFFRETGENPTFYRPLFWMLLVNTLVRHSVLLSWLS